MNHNVGMTKCPECAGRGHFPCLVDGVRDGRRFGELRNQTCPLCQGRGSVREHEANAYRERQAAGKAMLEDRKRRMMTLRQEAERLGITAQELSRRENGRE